jgi:diguanylate cyclase (GGDEF)-like protein
MSEYSSVSKLYIFSVLTAGVVLCLMQFPDLGGTRFWLFLLASLVTIVTQIVQVEGIIKDSSYNASLFGYSLALLALGRAEALWVAVISFLMAWIWKKGKTPWFALGFNIGSASISIALADLAYSLITQGRALHGFPEFAGMIAAGGVYIYLSQSITGMVYWLIDGKSFRESGHLTGLLLAADTTQFAMGASAALVWESNPYAILFALSPLYLIYLTLQLPILQLRAETDSKTRLYNARYFNEALKKELIRADRTNQPLSVVMADIDYLRNMNNTYGHLAGDTAIITIANVINRLIRNYDIGARFGGEEFAIIMPETAPEKAALRVEEIRQTIEATPIELTTTSSLLRVTMSFGIAGRERAGQKPSEIVNNADIALYQAKQAGRNQVRCYLARDMEVTTSP